MSRPFLTGLFISLQPGPPSIKREGEREAAAKGYRAQGLQLDILVQSLALPLVCSLIKPHYVSHCPSITISYNADHKTGLPCKVLKHLVTKSAANKQTNVVWGH